MLGTGAPIRGKIVYQGVQLSLQGVNIIENFLHLELGSSDLILGIERLGTLGMIKFNHKTFSVVQRQNQYQLWRT